MSLIGSIKRRAGPPPTPGVADYDTSLANRAHSREDVKRYDHAIVNEIRYVRSKHPDKREQLKLYRQMLSITEARHPDGCNADVLTDIRNAIDEIEIALGIPYGR